MSPVEFEITPTREGIRSAAFEALWFSRRFMLYIVPVVGIALIGLLTSFASPASSFWDTFWAAFWCVMFPLCGTPFLTVRLRVDVALRAYPPRMHHYHISSSGIAVTTSDASMTLDWSHFTYTAETGSHLFLGLKVGGTLSFQKKQLGEGTLRDMQALLGEVGLPRRIRGGICEQPAEELSPDAARQTKP
jgi:hypothetical protein